MADARTFIKVHDGIDEHPKIEALTDKAFRHLITLWCYCSRNLTDGLVAERTWKRITTPATARELVEHHLATPCDDGHRMHDYLQHQRSRAEVEDLSEKRRTAGRKGGKARANTQANIQASASPNAQANGQQNGSRAEQRREEPPYPPSERIPPPRQTSPPAHAEDDFNTFWDTYPRKVSKPAARAAWAKATTDAPATHILQGLTAALPQLQNADPQFIPHPATWLRDERWADQDTTSPDPWSHVTHLNPRPPA